MNEWLHNLPIVWMAFIIFGFTYLVAVANDSPFTGHISVSASPLLQVIPEG